MQFSFVAFFAAVTALAMAAPMPVVQPLVGRASCDVAKCAIALGPTAVGCGSAAIQAGADPISDIGCLAAALNAVVNVPGACSPCADELGITTAVGGALNSAENAIGSIF